MALSRIDDLLASRSIDALVATAPENVTYLTGSYNAVRSLIAERPSIVVWPSTSSPFVVAPEVEVAWLESNSSVDDITPYGGETSEAVEALVKRVKGTLLEKAAVGIDMEVASASVVRDIEESLPDWKLVDASDLVGDFRAIKTEDQVELLRQAALATDRAEWSALHDFEVGWTGQELGLALRVKLLEQGADSILFLNLGSGPDNRTSHPKPSSRPLGVGEVLRFDLGGLFDGWCTDIAKTAAIGHASDSQGETFRRLRGILDRHIQRIRPGAHAADLYRKVEDDFRDQGMTYRGPHVGHGIGLTVHEKPVLAPGSLVTLQAGMVLCAEVVHRATDTEFFHLEELVFVESDRSVLLSRSESISNELPIIG